MSVFDQEVARREAARRAVEGQIAAEERRISAANAEREAAYGELATLYAADDGKLAAEFGEVSQKLQRIFDAKMQRRRAINELLDQASALIAGLQAQVPSVQRQEHDAQERLDEARRAVEAQLAEDSAYRVLKREADGLQAAWEQLKAGHNRLRDEAAAKLPVFNGNRLFRYLVDCRYGTPDYHRSGVTAAGDRWVAGLVGWDRNYASYRMLCELPVFAEGRATEAQQRAELAATKVAFHVRECEAGCGVDAARTALAAATQARQEVQAQITQVEEKRAKLVAEVQGMDAGNDEFQQRAKTELKAFLAANPLSVLKAKAAATAQPRDDELVAQIERAEAAINDGRSHVKAMIEERNEAERQAQRAITARRKFASDYSGRYDMFDPGMNLNGMLTGYILGTMSDHLLWNHVDRHYHDATPTYAYGSSSSGGGFSFGGFSGGGGGFSGGFSTGGGGGGGGFSTGGGS